MKADMLIRELRHASRGMFRAPGFTLIVILTLALGIGATTAIFTMLDRVVLHPLPYADSQRLVWLDSPTPGVKPDSKWGLSVAEFFYFKKHVHTLEHMATFQGTNFTVVGAQSAERVSSALVSAGVFDLLGFRPVLGRALVEQDNLPNSAPVIVLGYDYWQQYFHGDAKVIGSMIDVNAVRRQIVGVMQAGAGIPDSRGQQVNLWVPFKLDPDAGPADSHFLGVIARLAPGATIKSAQAELARFTKLLPEIFPMIYPPSFMAQTGFSTEVVPLRDYAIGDIGKRLWILLGSVALVLVIACANVANLFLVRAEGRRREMAIRTVLGGRRSHFAWHHLTESMLLALVAGVVAVGLAFVGLRAMVALAPPELPRLDETHLGWASIAFTCAISLMAGLLFGLLALRGSAESGNDVMSLREGGRGLTSSRRQRTMRGALVAAQMALALVLLAAAALMLQSVRNLRKVQPGFDPAGVLTAYVSLPSAKYNSYDKVEAFYRELLTRVAALPDVKSAAAGPVPFEDYGGCSGVWTEDHPLQPGEQAPCVPTQEVPPGYFQTMGIKVRGRAPDWGDLDRASGAVVVTKALAERLWPGQDAIGKGIRGHGPKQPYYRVVGVTSNLRVTALDKPPLEGVFFPIAPIPGAPLWGPNGNAGIIVRSRTASPELLAPSLRRVVAEIDPSVPLANVQTLDAVVATSMTRLSFTMTLLGIAAGMALILSAIGIYGVISYIVGRRRGEIGIRMALGAHASGVGTLVVRQSVQFAVVGIVIGIIASLMITRVLSSVLFGVSPTDPMTLVVVSVIMLLIAVLASYVPAQRAMNVDPVEALRAD